VSIEWFCALRGRTEGPLSAERLLELRRRGNLSDATLVWCDGMPEWRPLTEALDRLEADAASAASTNSNSSTSTATSTIEYRVVELSPLSPYALEELLNRWAPEGWRLDQVVDGRLVVLRRG
jgi:hypothetical protein